MFTAISAEATGAQDVGMNERDVIERLGLPDEIVGSEDRMRSRSWVCCTCREIVTSREPIHCPAPCVCCGGIDFEAIRMEPN